MPNLAQSDMNIKIKRTLFGASFGLFFPLIGTLLDIWLKGLPLKLGSILSVQASNPVHWVVDLAPVILGLSFYQIGRRESSLYKTNSQLESVISELREIKLDLENRVLERTRELESVNQQNQRRAAQFESIAQTARSMTSLQALDVLLPQITNLISLQFGFYHVGIFLLDEEKKNALLAAANSEGGKKMIGRRHQLRIGQEGIVGYVTATGFPRIALDTGQDAVYFNNPELPTTRSEIALPLKIGKEIIGALDVQSTEASAFNNEDIASLSILADQVSITIQNTRRYESTLRSLEQSQGQYRQYMHEEWSRLSREGKMVGFRFSGGSGSLLEEPILLGEAGQTAEQGHIFQRVGLQASDTSELAIPVRLRGEVIGILSVSMPGRRQWTDDDIDIAEAVSERLALAIENARLFQTANQRAERERVVSDIASKIGGNIRIDSLLETTAQELSHALNGSEVVIQLQAVNQVGGQK
jgi:GAF domain-containing protein